jgi:hypothetical protein
MSSHKMPDEDWEMFKAAMVSRRKKAAADEKIRSDFSDKIMNDVWDEGRSELESFDNKIKKKDKKALSNIEIPVPPCCRAYISLRGLEGAWRTFGKQRGNGRTVTSEVMNALQSQVQRLRAHAGHNEAVLPESQLVAFERSLVQMYYPNSATKIQRLINGLILPFALAYVRETPGYEVLDDIWEPIRYRSSRM